VHVRSLCGFAGGVAAGRLRGPCNRY
jgi:hypothetical protein